MADRFRGFLPVVVDVETGGFDAEHDALLEIAAVPLSMDADGYLYFKGRSKRIIKVSGISVYPAQVEQVLEAHPRVRRACVIGLPDEYQMSSVKAFVVPVEGVAADDRLRDDLLAHCRKHLMRWAVPRSIEFREELPTTLVGKIAYTQLEQEELARAQ